MTLRYHIKYTWPSGKIRYRTPTRVCARPEDAEEYTLIDASQILKRSRDARIVWDIIATKERIK